jgi:hypothetical protein
MVSLSKHELVEGNFYGSRWIVPAEEWPGFFWVTGEAA